MRILIAAGGTGGHIWPAISFRDWIRKHKPDSQVLFVCGKRRIEQDIYAHENIDPAILPLEGSPLWGNLATRVSRSYDLLRSFTISTGIIRSFKPELCLVFGGYVAFPVIMAARMAGIPVILHEQNAKAGKVTRFCKHLGIRICTGWERCLPFTEKDFLHVGVPVRDMELIQPELAWQKLGFGDRPPSPPRCLVIGGSLGSDPLNCLIRDICSKEQFRGLNFIVVGQNGSFKRTERNLWMVPKEWNVSLLYSLADIVIARAGSSTLSELVAFKLPSVIIPWRNAADDHQMENAIVFSERGFGSIWEIDNGILENLSFMIDYELERARLGQAFTFSRDHNNEVCEQIWDLVQQTAEGRGRN